MQTTLKIGTYLIVYSHACKVKSYVDGGYNVVWLKSGMESRIPFDLVESKDTIIVNDVNVWSNFLNTKEAKDKYNLNILEAFASCVELINRDREKKSNESVV